MKNKKLIILISVIIVLLVGLSYLRTQVPKEVSWERSFYNTETDPYGTYITYQLLSDIFEKNNIRSTRRPIYSNLKKGLEKYINYGYDESYEEYNHNNYDIDGYEYAEDTIEECLSITEEYNSSSTDSVYNSDPSEWYHDIERIADTTSYIFINTSFVLDNTDLEYLLDFVGLGNSVFISAESYSRNFTDTLGVKIPISYGNDNLDSLYHLVDYPEKEYPFRNVYGQARITIDKSPYKIRPLAFDSENDTVFIELKYGRGNFYIHTLPSAFANVNVLQNDKYDFAFRSLSYLPKNSKVIWDEYQKQGPIGEDSMFRVLFTSTPLTIAFYLIVAGLLLFMIFRAKRTQRIIPIITPPVNSSVEFLNTISNLYYRKKDFKTIAEKRHAFFLDFIRKHYYLSTENIDEEFISVLSRKSGMEKARLYDLFSLYKDIRTLYSISNDMFLKYNSLLEEFYKTAKNK